MRSKTNANTLLLMSVFLVAAFGGITWAGTIYVDDDGPADFNNIQAAIDNSNHGDIIVVNPGTYTGEGNRDIDYYGIAITVHSIDPSDPNIVAATIIDCNGTEEEPHRGFYFHNDEGANSILSGFTITNGYAYTGGGICCGISRPTITNCVITGNTGDYGAGIYCGPNSLLEPPSPPPPGPLPPPPPPPDADGEQSSAQTPLDFNLPGPTITNCIFTENFGSAIYCGPLPVIGPPPPPPPPPLPPGAYGEESSAETPAESNLPGPMITNCIVSDNSLGGIHIIDCNATVIDSIFSGNLGRGMSISGSNSKLVNCIFIENQHIGLYISRSNATLINCNFRENYSGENGGGIYNCNDSNTTLINCIFSDNVAIFFIFGFFSGGGIYNYHSSLTVTDCTFIGNSAGYGGGIYSTDDSSATFTNCIFKDNSSLFHGGGIYNRESFLTLNGCTFRNNSSEHEAGGGIYSEDSRPIITNCTFTENSAPSSGGGGIYLYRSPFHQPPSPPQPPLPPPVPMISGGEQSYQEILSDYNVPGPVIFNCTFTGNSARGGGGLVIDEPNSSILKCVFSDNSAGSGGGMSNSGDNTLLSYCIFVNNSAQYSGGGMFNTGNYTSLTKCVFSGNTAYEGGGMQNYSVRDATLYSCRFSGNRAIKDGGGMHNFRSTIWMYNSTYSENLAVGDGGGIWWVKLHSSTPSPPKPPPPPPEPPPPPFPGEMSGDSIIAKDVDLSESEVYIITMITSCIFRHNRDSTGTGRTGQIFVDLEETPVLIGYSCVPILTGFLGNIDTDPGFVELGSWADPNDPNIALDPMDPNAIWIDGDYHLQPESPCINVGDPEYIAGPNETDLDGNPRIIGDRIDMGAYELQNTSPVANAGPDQLLECACNTAEPTMVTLDGSSSYDADGDPLTFTWTGPFVGSPADGATPTVTLETACPDDYVITLVVNDGTEDSGPDEVVITVVDTTPPDFELSVSPTMLWPPDHKMYEITQNWTVSDDCDATPDVMLVSIAMSEVDDIPGGGNTSDDIRIGEDGSIYLRSERSGTSSERIYTITYQAVDDYGNTSLRSATVGIPHDFKVLARIAAQWLRTNPSGRIPEDLNGDGIVNLSDFARFAENWIR